MAGKRKGWSQLSPSYQARLQRAGITAKSYRNADLRGARGHKDSRPLLAAPKAATELGVSGRGTNESRRELQSWRDNFSPRWLPQSGGALDTDVVAALSQLPSPRQWTDVHFTPRGGGEPWVMEVGIKGGYDRQIEIPGGSDARDVLHLLTSPDWFDMDDYDAWEDWVEDYDFDVGNSE